MGDRRDLLVGGYFAAALTATIVLTFEFSVGAYFQSSTYTGPFNNWIVLALMPVFSFLPIVAASALPAALMICYAERHRVRSALVYGLAGAVVGVLAYLLYALLLMVTAGTSKGFGQQCVDWGIAKCAGSTLLMFCMPGSAGALVYWFIAGRRAGEGNQCRIDMRTPSR